MTDNLAAIANIGIGALIGAWLNNFFGLRPLATKVATLTTIVAVLQASVERIEREINRRLEALEGGP